MLHRLVLLRFLRDSGQDFTVIDRGHVFPTSSPVFMSVTGILIAVPRPTFFFATSIHLSLYLVEEVQG